MERPMNLKSRLARLEQEHRAEAPRLMQVYRILRFQRYCTYWGDESPHREELDAEIAQFERAHPAISKAYDSAVSSHR